MFVCHKNECLRIGLPATDISTSQQRVKEVAFQSNLYTIDVTLCTFRKITHDEEAIGAL
jgi:hypothetical protein